MKRNLVLGLTLVLALGCLSAEGAEQQGTKTARTARAAVSAPTVVDKLVRTIRSIRSFRTVRTIQTIPRPGRLAMADLLAAPKTPSLDFPVNVLDLPDCSSLLDPDVECRVYQPVGG